mmetsp:Transcript_837/g.2001  ORF Transcript_837/g.2001 Transcript_837/m.2001 type:complete len:293 (-) Transcript_837:352-1230(-)|eukprot:CAMPEP_0172457322 /NCGR_PEP_ID=MMETSP1065-20121228/21472_1 /TAXON_ID=265537 /ORGANISM="Amphiprora paludosa, Strain CCMP125" /LENGTH=292 /DNA_ID=CAMNT_0013210985 /DNA_START=151 /DNA_END=1029 /DNA_ORIENTATION=+
MENGWSFVEGALTANICGCINGTYDFFNKTSSPSALAFELKRRVMTEDSRLVGVSEIPYLNESPITRLIDQVTDGYLPGKTYLIYARPENGKSVALQDYIARKTARDHAGLYINVNGNLDIVKMLQKRLNTTCDSYDIVEALVAALGQHGAAGEKNNSSILVLDEVNHVDMHTPEGAATASFIQDLFQSIGDDRSMFCIIASNKASTADALVHLNGGKTMPHPNFLNTAWAATQQIDWSDVQWTVPQLEALLRLKFPNANTTSTNFDFLATGMSPGDAVSRCRVIHDATRNM